MILTEIKKKITNNMFHFMKRAKYLLGFQIFPQSATLKDHRMTTSHSYAQYVVIYITKFS